MLQSIKFNEPYGVLYSVVCIANGNNISLSYYDTGKGLGKHRFCVCISMYLSNVVLFPENQKS